MTSINQHDVHRIEVRPESHNQSNWLELVAYNEDGDKILQLALFNNRGSTFDVRSQVIEAVRETAEVV